MACCEATSASVTRSRSPQIFLHQERWQREDVADVIKPTADVIGRKVVGRFEINAEQVPHGVVVFRTVQPPDGHATGIGGSIAIDVIYGRFNPADQFLPLFLAGLRLIFRRHRAGAEHLDHRLPGFFVLGDELNRFVFVKGDVGLLLGGAMTVEAELFDQRHDIVAVDFVRRAFARTLVRSSRNLSRRATGKCESRQDHQERNEGSEFHNQDRQLHSNWAG